MSNLRFVACAVGSIGLFITFIVYRGPRWNKSNFILFTIINLSSVIIAINPNVLNSLRYALSLEGIHKGRIISLLIISNIFLLFYIFFVKLKEDKLNFQFDRLIRQLSAKEIERELDLTEHIKPIMILIPAYNEAESLKELLVKIPKQIDGIKIGVLVVDDGSEDATYSTAVSTDGVCAVKNLINRGGGAALRLGYDILKKRGCRICVTMDADGQHRPEEIERLLLPLISNQYDCVIGSRILGRREKTNWIRIIGVRLFGIVITGLLGKKITDPSSGFRAFKMDAMSSIELNEDQYHTSELIIEAVKKGLRIGDVPVTILKRKYGKSKKGKEFVFGLNFAWIILKTWWR